MNLNEFGVWVKAAGRSCPRAKKLRNYLFMENKKILAAPLFGSKPLLESNGPQHSPKTGNKHRSVDFSIQSIPVAQIEAKVRSASGRHCSPSWTRQGQRFLGRLRFCYLWCFLCLEPPVRYSWVNAFAFSSLLCFPRHMSCQFLFAKQIRGSVL